MNMDSENGNRLRVQPLPSEELLTQTESRAAASVCRLRTILNVFKHQSRPKVIRQKLPQISASRLAAERDGGTPGTKFYLAYGSNLCYETFQGRRGIRPLAHLNVVVPTLRMTFDLPGFPYLEPAFANSATRDPTMPPVKNDFGSQDYHKDRWKKGMVGVVYEVTLEDYAHIIATEGGGASYKDILVDCYPLAAQGGEVPEHPHSEVFKAHTLFAPVTPLDDPNREGGRFQRPDPSYAQPSARYLKLITDGAEENELPKEYKDYLYGIRPYEARSQKTQLGAFIFGMMWFPFLTLFLELSKMYQDENGNIPAWLAKLSSMFFMTMWNSYDTMFKPIFGDGERTDYSKKPNKERRRNDKDRRCPKHDEEWAEKQSIVYED